MATICDLSSSDNYCLICGSLSVDGSHGDDSGRAAETFLSCLNLKENYNDLISEHLDGIKFCLKCKLKLEELNYVQSQVERLLMRSKQLKISIITDAVQKSSVPLKNSSASWIRRLIRNKFHPRVFLKKCDSGQLKIGTEIPRKSSPVARKKSHSSRVSMEPKEIREPNNTDSIISVRAFDASSLLHIKFEQFESEEIEDLEMRDPLELNGNEVALDDSELIEEDNDNNTQVDGTVRAMLKKPKRSATNSIPTVTPLYKILPSAVEMELRAPDVPALSMGNNTPVGSLGSEPPHLVRVEGDSYRVGKLPVKRLGNTYTCLTCGKSFGGKNTSLRVTKHVRHTHVGWQDSAAWPTFKPKLVREVSPREFLYRNSVPFSFDERDGSFTCGRCGIKVVSNKLIWGKERIMRHMKHVHTLEDVMQEATEEGQKSSYEYEGFRVTVINDKHICEATGCSKFFVGKQARRNVIMHIRRCHLKQMSRRLKGVTEVKPGEYLYRKKLPFTYKDGIIQCGLCPRIFLTDKSPAAAEDKLILHLKYEHSDEQTKPTNKMKKPVEPAKLTQNLPTANTVVSQPITLLDQGSRSVFHIQTYPVLQNGQSFLAIVPSANPNQQVCISQPSVNGQDELLGQLSSVSPSHSAGSNVLTNPVEQNGQLKPQPHGDQLKEVKIDIEYPEEIISPD